MLLYELLFESSPKFDISEIRKYIKNDVDIPEDSGKGGTHVIFHKNHVITFKDGKIAPQTVMFQKSELVKIENYKSDIEQSWKFKNAAVIMSKCSHSILVSEMMTRTMDPKIRIELFHNVLRPLIEIYKPAAIVCKNSHQVISSSSYIESADRDEISRAGSLNVLFYNIQNSNGDMLMVTSGLSSFGYYELQCHFRNLNPGEVARVLFNTAIYVFDNGEVIKSGQTVEGCFPGSKWKCQVENALMDEKLVVLDLNPGPEHSAGNR